MTDEPSALRRLARLHDIQTAYTDIAGKVREASPEALLRVLQHLGAPVRRLEDAPAALRQRRLALWRRGLPPAHVAWEGTRSAVPLRLPARAAPGTLRAPPSHLEAGGSMPIVWDLDALPRRCAREVESERFVAFAAPLPEGLPLGVHRLESGAHRCAILSAPTRAWRAPGAGDAWGIFAPLYALHSERSWGVGDLTDYANLLTWTRGLGGETLATLPLLASFLGWPGSTEADRPFDPSPYAPASRLFWNELYLDPVRCPEFAGNPRGASARGQRGDAPARSAALRRTDARRLPAGHGRQAPGAGGAVPRLPCRAGARPRRSPRPLPGRAPRSRELRRASAPSIDRHGEPWPSWPERCAPARSPADFERGRAPLSPLRPVGHGRADPSGGAAHGRGRRTLPRPPPGRASPTASTSGRDRASFALGRGRRRPARLLLHRRPELGLRSRCTPSASARTATPTCAPAWRTTCRRRARCASTTSCRCTACSGSPAAWSQGRRLRPLPVRGDVRGAGAGLDAAPERPRGRGPRHSSRPPCGRPCGATASWACTSCSTRCDPMPRTLWTPPRPDAVASLNTHDMPPFAAWLQGLDVADRKDLGLLDEDQAAWDRGVRCAQRRALHAFLQRQGLPAEDTLDSLLFFTLAHLRRQLDPAAPRQPRGPVAGDRSPERPRHVAGAAQLAAKASLRLGAVQDERRGPGPAAGGGPRDLAGERAMSLTQAGSLLTETDLFLFNEGRHHRLYEKMGAHPATVDGVAGAHFAVWAPDAHARGGGGRLERLGPRARIRCARAAPAESGRASSPGRRRARATSTTWPRATTGYRADKADPFGFRTEVPPRHRLRGLGPRLHLGATATGWPRAPSGRTLARPDVRSTRCTWAPGAAREAAPASSGYREIARAAGRLRGGDGLHPRRAAAGDGAPVLRLVGLPGHRLLRAHRALRHAAGPHVPDRPPAPARDRGDPRLGAPPLPHRRARPGLLRRHPPLRARRPAARASTPTGAAHLQLRPQRGAQLPDQQRPLLARPLPRRRPARGRRGLHALPRLLAQGRRVDPQRLRRPREPGGHRASCARLNAAVYEDYPDVQTIAEESTSWPMVSRPTYAGRPGLRAQVGHGLDARHPRLLRQATRSIASSTTSASPSACSTPSPRTSCCRSRTTRSCTARARSSPSMPGDDWQQLANLRLLFGYQYAQPGKKLLFMGGEFGQWREWNHDASSTGTCSPIPPTRGAAPLRAPT